MNYTEVTIECKNTDEVCDRLTALGIDGFVIENEDDFKAFLDNNRQYWDYVDSALEDSYRGVSRVKFYVEDNDKGAALLAAVRAEFEVKTASVCDADWENNWKQYYEPLEIGEKLLVVPEWIDCSDEGRMPLRLDPGLLFGTGSHATTRMCLTALEKYAGAGKRALDLGCGSGILSIASLLLSAEDAVAVDIDPIAERIARENADMNGLGNAHYHIKIGDVLTDARLQRLIAGQYDVVVANIVADVIIRLAPLAKGYCKPGAPFIVSGVIDERRDEVLAALRAAGFTVEDMKNAEGWNAILSRA